MLSKIELDKFRCFENSKMSLKELAIIVGKNNSGKSSFIEALRIISMASRKCTKTMYTYPPKELGLPSSIKGFRLPIGKLKIDLRAIVYYYLSDTAKITATFTNKTKIVIYLNEEIAFATIIDDKGNSITTKAKALLLNIPQISILPQIGLIKENEKRLTDATIFDDIDTYLSSRHFRNEMLLFKSEFFKQFKRFSEETWPGLRVRSLDYDSITSDYISLFVEDAKFPAEIGLMGSGIQMWLQIIWFICRSQGNETIILDEPDVYMHPDLQLKILSLVKSLYKQVIIATHSVEIISNVSPSDIVTIDKKDRQMRYVNNLSAVQDIVDDIGSAYNLSLTKLNSAKKCIFVEGEDIKILQQFYNVLYPNNISTLDTIPSLPLGGFKRINEAFGAAKLFNESTKGHFKCYAILDRDYYLESEINDQKKKAIVNHLLLHIWNKKELENYIVIPVVLFRLISNPRETLSEFIENFEFLIETFKDQVIDSYTTKIQENDRGLAAGTAAAHAREYVNSKWINIKEKLDIVPGKDLLRATNKWMTKNYNVSCSMRRIFYVMKPEDIDPEIIEVLKQLTE